MGSTLGDGRPHCGNEESKTPEKAQGEPESFFVELHDALLAFISRESDSIIELNASTM
jgi:hypothetical protein